MFSASLVTGFIAIVSLGVVFARATPRDERGLTACCIIATTPMCWLMFHCVRLPLDGWLNQILGDAELLRWIRTAYAPITEEPAKLWPLLLPFIRRVVTRQNVARYALALGSGFALGEVFTVAALIAARQPQTAALPWYQLTPFITERLMTVVIHSGVTAIVLAAWKRGPGFIAGLFAAMTAHWFVNIPIALAQQGWFGSSQFASQMIVTAWIVVCFIAGIAWLGLLDVGQVGLGVLLHGRTVCPGCGRGFERRLLRGLNFGVTRYEPCPHCQKWNWTRPTQQNA